MPPYAVRIRTATGWQDIALTGPPGPKGAALFYNVVDYNIAGGVGGDGTIGIDPYSTATVGPTVLYVAQKDLLGNDSSGLITAIGNLAPSANDGLILSNSLGDRWTQYDKISKAQQSGGYRLAATLENYSSSPLVVPTPNCTLQFLFSGGQGPVGPIGPPGGYQMYAYGTGSGNVSGTSTTLIPLTLPAAQITKSDGTNPDFILNPNKTVKIVTAGYYLVNAEVGANQSSSVTQNFNSFLYLTGTDTTGTDPYSWQQIDEQHAIMTNVSGYGAITTHAIGRYFNAGDNVAVLASYGNSAIWTNVLTFSISRIGSGQKGADGLVTIYEQPNTPTNPVVGSVWVDTDDSVPSGTVVPRRTGFSWAIKGTIIAETQPSYFVPIATGQISQLLGVRAKIASGTSVVCQLQQNGTNIGTAVTVTPTKATTLFTPIALADGDEIALVTSSPTGNPVNLSITAIMEHRA